MNAISALVNANTKNTYLTANGETAPTPANNRKWMKIKYRAEGTQTPIMKISRMELVVKCAEQKDSD